MDLFKDRRRVLAIGVVAAVVAGVILAVVVASGRRRPEGAAPASRGGLVVQTGRDDDIKLDPKKPLRCFVGGQFVGETPLSDCARRNGVPAGALDVGLDPSGALAASRQGGAAITPLATAPEPPVAPEPEASPSPEPDGEAPPPQDYPPPVSPPRPWS